MTLDMVGVRWRLASSLVQRGWKALFSTRSFYRMTFSLEGAVWATVLCVCVQCLVHHLLLSQTTGHIILIYDKHVLTGKGVKTSPFVQSQKITRLNSIIIDVDGHVCLRVVLWPATEPPREDALQSLCLTSS